MSEVLTALLPVVLAMVAGTRRGGSGGSGGLGDLLGQVLGGGEGRSASDARGASAQGGGLADLLEQFQRSGFGRKADSWVRRGSSLPISPDVLTQVFGREGLDEIARRAGVDREAAAGVLAELLPEVVDRVTPDGSVPEAGSLSASVEAMLRRQALG